MEELRVIENYEDKLSEECAVSGAYDISGGDVAADIYYSLLTMQHRGQESAGISVTDTSISKCKVKTIKNMGLVNEVFNETNLATLKGNLGVGHVRYSTAGGSIIENAQPLAINYIKGTLAFAHNGNLVNTPELREELARDGAIFQTTIDSELIVYCIAKERVNSKTVEEAVSKTMKRIKGAYSLVIKSPRKLIGVRDPHGFKPLCIGKRDNTFFIVSESCALDTIDAEFVRDIEPGEIVVINSKGEISSDKSNCIPKEKQAVCVFEYLYFARPDAYIDGESVYNSRLRAGEFLAKDSFVEADIVVGVPESGNGAAMGYSLATGIPYSIAFVKNSYIGRTFIKPKQKTRQDSVKMKLNVLKEVVRDKRVILVDDSIVRGTTSKKIVDLLRKAGAKEVHMRSSAPAFLYPCYFGTDIPSQDQLVAHNRTVEEIRDMIGVDTLAYLNVDRLKELAPTVSICKGCFDGKYPLDPPSDDIRGEFDE